jgi:hypothetical protein
MSMQLNAAKGRDRKVDKQTGRRKADRKAESREER